MIEIRILTAGGHLDRSVGQLRMAREQLSASRVDGWRGGAALRDRNELESLLLTLSALELEMAAARSLIGPAFAETALPAGGS